MTNFFAGTLQYWVDLGLYDVFLPFIFIYTIVYAILKQTKILGSHSNVNSLVAFCFGFIATASIQTITTIHLFFSATGFFVVAGLCVMIIIGLFGLKSINTGKKWYNKLPRYGVLSIIGLGFFYLIAVGLEFDTFLVGFLPFFPRIITQTIIVGAVFVIIMWYIIGSNDSSNKNVKKESARNSDEKKNVNASDSGNNQLVEKIELGDEAIDRQFP